MSELSQEEFAKVLEAAAEHVRVVKHKTGVDVELRLDVTGLAAKAYNADLGFGQTVPVDWRTHPIFALFCSRRLSRRQSV
jgi:hypothetical protein